MEEIAPDKALERLRSIALAGMQWLDAQATPVGGAALTVQMTAAEYRVEVPRTTIPGGETGAAAALAAFSAAGELLVTIDGKRGPREVNLGKSIPSCRLEPPTDPENLSFLLTVSLGQGEYVNPVVALARILGADFAGTPFATRTGFAI